MTACNLSGGRVYYIWKTGELFMILENCTLTEKILIACAQDAGLTAEDCNELEICRKQVLEDPELLDSFTKLYDNLFSGEKFDPQIFTEIDEFSCRFRLLLSLNWIPRIREVFRKNSWSEKAMFDTMGDIGVWARHCRNNFGFCGFHKWGSAVWLSGHGFGRLIQLGRLQFNLDAVYRHPAAVYRNRENGEVIALAAENTAFAADGLLATSPENTAWITTFNENTDRVSGYPITPAGLGENRIVTLDTAKWNRILSPGDKVINFHIPETGPMTVEACKDSIDQAVKFFAEYYPDYPWKAIYVSSWFNDPVYEKYLPPKSNIMKFHTAGYLLPENEIADPLPRVFPGTTPAPGGSSLQNAVYRMIEDKIVFRRGTLFLLKEDLPWRENTYRKSN